MRRREGFSAHVLRLSCLLSAGAPQLQGALGLTAPNCRRPISVPDLRCRATLELIVVRAAPFCQSSITSATTTSWNFFLALADRHARRRSGPVRLLPSPVACGRTARRLFVDGPASGGATVPGAVGSDRARPVARSRRRRNARRALDTDDPQPPPNRRRSHSRERCAGAGVGVPDGQSPQIYAWSEPRPGWYLNWSVGFTETVWITGTLGAQPAFHIPPDETAGMEFAPMVRTPQGRLEPRRSGSQPQRARPGHTWLIGNEPDVRWQDGATPEAYAAAYHTAYTTIMQADPTAQVGFAGLSQITPLRLAFWSACGNSIARPTASRCRSTCGTCMPLCCKRRPATGAWTCRPASSTSPRASCGPSRSMTTSPWWRSRCAACAPGWRRTANAPSPSGSASTASSCPPITASTSPACAFLFGSYDLFNSLRDPALGYAADDDRLVQRWVWFSAGYDLYPTGDLFARDGGQPA